MNQFLEFAILGIATGALYVPLALGIVIIRRGTGVVNFAQGALGMFGTYIFWELSGHVPYGVAFAIGVASTALLGLIIHFGAMRPLRASSELTKVIATLAVLTILEQAASFIFPPEALTLPSELPITPVTIFGASVGENFLYILLIAVVLTAVLAVVYRYTQFGRATVASAENRRAVASLGYSPDVLGAGNWMIGGAIACVAGILLAPITGLTVTEYSLLIVPALAVAVFGGLASFPLTLLGGFVVGLIQSEMGRYISSQGWAGASPFFVLIIVLIVRGNNKSLRTTIAQHLPRLGTGRIRPLIVIPAAIIACLIVEIVPAGWDDAFSTTVGTSLILLSFVIVTGYTGQLSLAQFAFAGYGAWVAGLLASYQHWPFLAAIVVGAIAALPVGLLLGFICLRTRGVNLAIATLGLAVALEQIIFDSPNYTNQGAINVPLPTIGGLDIDDILHSNRYAIVVIVFFVLCAIAVANLRRSRAGRRMLAVRANERAAASIGIGVTGAKLAAFGSASVLAALGGALLAFRDPSIVYTNYSSLTSIQIVSQSVVGGVGWIGGTIYGGVLEVGSVVGNALDELGPNVSQYLPLVAGVLLLAVLISAPDGLAYQDWRRIGLLRARLGRPRPVPEPPVIPEVEAHRVTPRVLTIEDLSVRFGGVTALDGVSLRVRPGEIVGLIGPNGAGKTTLIDVVTGYVGAARGRVRINDTDIEGRTPTRIARSGLGRSFQSLELFDDMTVMDNLQVACERHDLLAYLSGFIYSRKESLTASLCAAIREFSLQSYLMSTPSSLPYGRRRLVGIARAVATEASVILLDEPAAGLDQNESADLGSLLRRLADEWGMGILLIEHDVELVMRVCDRVHVLNFGRQIAEGTPDEVRADPAVVDAYLGQRVPVGAQGPEVVGSAPTEDA
jgi:ABC-type branched-subunit amino acid transport system ATPase component/branched-subunit amino acid ABC-type transport system permease component